MNEKDTAKENILLIRFGRSRLWKICSKVDVCLSDNARSIMSAVAQLFVGMNYSLASHNLGRVTAFQPIRIIPSNKILADADWGSAAGRGGEKNSYQRWKNGCTEHGCEDLQITREMLWNTGYFSKEEWEFQPLKAGSKRYVSLNTVTQARVRPMPTAEPPMCVFRKADEKRQNIFKTPLRQNMSMRILSPKH